MSVEDTLSQRGSRYGEFTGHASLAQALKQVMWAEPKYHLLQDDQKEALEMIQHKVSRILNGDPNYADNWHDIAGYATLIDKRLTAEEKFL
jgi:hypothetical protein